MKTARHEREKQYMEALHAVGHAVREYVSGGQGDAPSQVEDPHPDVEMEIIDAEEECVDPGEFDSDANDQEEQEDSSDQAQALMFFDYEATGLSIYDDHVTDIAAKVVGVPLTSVSQPTFSILVHTPRNKVKETGIKQ